MALLNESYDLHSRDEERFVEEMQFPSRFAAPGSIDCLHHDRMYQSLIPLLREVPDSEWLTVGDGQFGADASFLQERVREVTASSLSDTSLRIAKQRGWILRGDAQNAEGLSYPDGTFDYVLCKAAYHHFPRPSIGLYEMLRVARSGVALIEPFDGGWSPLEALKRYLKRLLRGEHDYDQFEPVGNYVFRLSVRETFKIVTALGYYAIAWRTMNVFWHAAVCGANRNAASPRLAAYWLAVRTQDAACALRLLSPGIVTLICFKTDPGSNTLDELRRAGFRVEIAPRNPYR